MNEKQINILLIEDNPGDARLVKLYLEENGVFHHKLRWVENLAEGLNVLATEMFDVILLDLNLPDSRGIETLARINLYAHLIPVILLTGVNDEKTELDAIKMGAQDYFIKGEVKSDLLIRQICFTIERKKIVGELEYEKNRAQNYLDIAGVMIVAINENMQVTMINEKGCITLGYDISEIIGKNIVDAFILEDEKEKVKETFGQVLHGEIELIKDIEFSVITKSGNVKLIEWHNSLLKDIDGKITGTLSSGLDITESRHKEELMRDSEEKFAIAFLTSPYAITITSVEDGRFIDVNTAFSTITGFTKEEALSNSSIGLKIWADPNDRINVVAAITSGKKIVDEEFLFRKKNGEIITCLFSASIISLNSKHFILSSINNITERKQSEKTLCESEAKLDEAAKIAQLGTWEYDVDREQFLFNDQFYSLLHTTAEREGGYTMPLMHYANKFLHPDDVAMVGVETKKALETSDPIYYSRIDHRIICADGEIGYFNVNIKIVKDRHGRTVKTYGVNQVITERKQAVEKLQTSESKFRAVAKLSPVAIYCSSGSDQKAVYINETFYKTFGFSMEDVPTVGHWWIKAFPDDKYRQKIHDQWVFNIEQANKNNGDVEALECVCTCKDGSEKNINWVGKTIGKEFWAFGYDVTERKNREVRMNKINSGLLSLKDDYDENIKVLTALAGELLGGTCVLYNRLDGNLLCLIGKWNAPHDLPTEDDPFGHICYDLIQNTSESVFVIHDLQKSKYAESDPNVIPYGLQTYVGHQVRFGGKICGALCSVYTKDHQPTEDDLFMLGILASAVGQEEERNKAKEEISKMANILESTPDLVGMADRQGNVFYLNQGGKLIMGMNTSKDITKLKISDFHPEDIVQLIMHEGLPTASKKGFWSSETKLLSTAGEEIPILQVILCHRNSKNIITHYSTIARDIRESKRAEEKVQKLSLAVEQSPVTVVITDKEGEIEYVNARFYELTGYTKEEVIGKNPSLLKSDKHSKSFYEELWNTILSGKVWKGEMLNKKKNGEIYWESASISPLLNNEGEITHFVAMKEDITEKMKMISELYEAKEKAESASKLKDAFINNMSHEIRTPLNGIVGLSSLIKESYSQYMVEDDESLFTGIDASAQRIIRTVDMILNYSRLQSGEFTVIPKQINLFEICESIIQQNKDAAEVKSLELLFDNRCDGTKITGDEYTITQIVSNLLDNAIKYTKKGTVEIAILPGIEDGIILEIKDTGIGIAKEYLDHLFEPYRQEDMGYGRSYEGVGLGLALTKKFVELNNAVLFVESIKGEGTTLRIKFNGAGKVKIDPFAMAERIVTINPTVSKRESKPIILIVEDDKFNQEILKRVLTKKYRTYSAVSAEGAYEVLKNNEIDLILMDISINGEKDGLVLTKELKAAKKYLHIPVIAVTAHAGNDDRRNALAAGCDEYLAKPFSMDQLFKKIGKFVKEE